MIAQVPPTLAWHIYQIIVNYLSLVVFVCVLNQFKYHHSKSDALHFIIFVSLKLKRKMDIPLLETYWKRIQVLFLN